MPAIDHPAPVLSIAVVPVTKADDTKLATALHRLVEEDPALVVVRDDDTGQTVLSGTGEMHLATSVERLRRKFGVQVQTEPVQVAYRETISTPVPVYTHTHKKQTGGHGQFAQITISAEPLERGAGFEFENRIVGGAISKGYVPAVERGIQEGMARGGGIGGYPIVDVRITLTDGKEHSVDSSEMAFRHAAAVAIKEVVMRGTPVLLEPVSLVEVTVPSDQLGDVLGDLNARRGRVHGTEPGDLGEQVVRAHVPQDELRTYATDLRSLTGGRGRFSATHDHYDVVPPTAGPPGDPAGVPARR